MNEEQVKGIVDSMNKQGATPDEIQRAITHFGEQQTQDTAQQDLPWYKNLTQELWKGSGVGNIVASGSKLEAQTLALGAELFGHKDFANNLQASIDRTASEGVDMGSWLGKVRPLDENSPLDAVAQGAKAASFFTPVGEAKFGAMFGSKFLGKAAQWMTNLAPFTVPMAVGTGLENLNKGESVAGAGLDTIKSLGEQYLTLGLFKGGGSLMKWASAPLMKSAVVRDIAGRTTQLADKMYSLFQDARGASQRDLNTLMNEFTSIHKDASRAVGESLIDKSAPEMTWEIMKRKVGDLVKKGYDASSDQFSDVYNPNIFIPKESMPQITKEVTNALTKFDVPEDVAQNFLSGKGMGNVPVQGILGNFLSDLKTVMFKNDGKIPFDQINSLWRDYSVGSPKPAENQAIKNILMSLNKDARSFLNSDSKYAGLAERWDKAGELWSNLSNGLNGKFNNLMKVAANPKSFVDSIFTKNPKDLAEELRLLTEGLGGELQGLDDQTRRFLSHSIRNNVIETALNYSRNPAQGGDKLKTFLDLWEPKGILHPEDVTALDKLSDFMTGTYEDFANGVKEATGLGETMTNLRAKGQGVSGATSKVEHINSAFKILENKPLYIKMENGTYDFSNFSKFIEKLNTHGEFDDAVKEISRYGDLSAIPANKIPGVIRTIVGASMAVAGHPIFGGGYALRGIGDLIGKAEEKVTRGEVEKFITNSVKSGDLKGAQKILFQIVSGNLDKAGSVLNRGASYTFDKFLEAAGILKGSSLDENDKNDLKSHWNSI